MTYIERLLKRRASWERELAKGSGPLAKAAPAILAQIDLEIASHKEGQAEPQ
jgi:hypothetical protein